MKIVIIPTILTLIVSCSSSQPKLRVEDNSETIKKDYVVRGASSDVKPQWVEDAGRWAQKHDKDVKKYKFYSFETTPKVNRNIACSLAKTQTRADIASEIASFIEKTLGTSTEGQAGVSENDPELAEMREYVETTLAEKVKGMIHGSSVETTYWEKRKYQKKLGSKRNYTGYTCAALVKIETDRLKKAVDRAAILVQKKANSTSSKEKVEKALKNVSDNFVKS